jgi:hypothetical protein
MIREPAPGRIVRIDPATRQITTTIDLPGDPWDIAAGFGAVWAPDRTRPVMYRIDEATGTISEIALPAPVLHVLAADGAIWTTSDEDRKGEFSPLVVRIDPSNSEVTATIPVDASELHELMTLGSRIFVETGTGLAEIDPSTNRIVRSIERTNGLFAASYAAADTIWEAACVPHGASEPKDKEKSAPCTWQVARIDPDSGDTITQAAVGHWVEPFPSDGVITQSVTVVGGDSTMWVLAFDLVATTGKPTEERTRLLQVDPANGKVLTTTVFRTTPRSIGLYELEIQDRAVWVAPGWEEVVETPLATR